MIHGYKIWTSYSDVADWCLLLRVRTRTSPNIGISAFVVSMHQPGVEQRPLKMISGVTKEFGQVGFEGARVPAENMVGTPGEAWKLAMTVVSHEREPSTLGFRLVTGSPCASWHLVLTGRHRKNCCGPGCRPRC